jgi:hypothetical protein
MTISIMQPTYLPWVGYFDLIDQVDTFVFLEDVEFNERSWQQRNRIRTSDGLQWLTVPVRKTGRSGQLISEVEIVTDGREFPEKHLKALKFNYSHADHFDPYFSELEDVITEAATTERLSTLNKRIIKWLAQKVEISADFLDSSSLPSSGSKAELLAEICDELGADVYLSPMGSLDYLEAGASSFRERGIDLRFQNYHHPTYDQQFDGFESHASAVDLLFNKGDQFLEIVWSGRGEPHTLSDALSVQEE